MDLRKALRHDLQARSLAALEHADISIHQRHSEQRAACFYELCHLQHKRNARTPPQLVLIEMQRKVAQSCWIGVLLYRADALDGVALAFPLHMQCVQVR